MNQPHLVPDWCPAIGETVHLRVAGSRRRPTAYIVGSYENVAHPDKDPDWCVRLNYSNNGRLAMTGSIEMLRTAAHRKHLETLDLARRLSTAPIKAKVNQTFDMDGLPLFDDTRHQIDMF